MRHGQPPSMKSFTRAFKILTAALGLTVGLSTALAFVSAPCLMAFVGLTDMSVTLVADPDEGKHAGHVADANPHAAHLPSGSTSHPESDGADSSEGTCQDCPSIFDSCCSVISSDQKLAVRTKTERIAPDVVVARSSLSLTTTDARKTKRWLGFAPPDPFQYHLSSRSVLGVFLI